MRASEFIFESESEVEDSAAHAMPTTFVLPELQNQDAYHQYRFGVALAAARAHASGEVDVNTVSEFGENMVVVARSAEEEETLMMALKLFGPLGKSKMISTRQSEESKDVGTTSPTPPRRKNKYGV